MTKWSSYSDSPYLNAGDFADGEEKRFTIQSVRSELVGRDRDSKPVAYFEEEDSKPLILNRTNQRKLAVCGPGTEDCVGASISLHVIETEYGGEPVQGVRIGLVVPPARKSAVPPQAPPPKEGGATFAPNARTRGKTAAAAQDMDDSIPFAPEWR